MKYAGTGVGTVTKPTTSADVNFGFQTTYGLQTTSTGVLALGPDASYAYRLSRRNGGPAYNVMEILQKGTRFNLNSDRFLFAAADGNTNGTTETIVDVSEPVYTSSSSYMLSTRVKNNDEYPIWISGHRGISTYGNTGAMMKIKDDEIAFMGSVRFLKGMNMTGQTVNMDSDMSGTINIGAQSSFVNIGNGPQITAVSIGSGANSVPSSIDIGTKTAGIINIGLSMSGDLNLGTGISNGTVNLGTGMTTGVVNIGTSSNGGKSIINIGGPGDEVNVTGSLTYINTTNLDVSNNLITLNKGAPASSQTIKGSGIQIVRLNNVSVETFMGWVKTDTVNAQSWEIVPPVHPYGGDYTESGSGSSLAGNGLAVCNVKAPASTEVRSMVGLKNIKSPIQNIVFDSSGNVGMGYADAALAGIKQFPNTNLHIENTVGNQIILGSGNDTGNFVRTFISSPVSTNGNTILAVGRASLALERATSIRDISSGFRFTYTHNALASSSTLALACTQNDATFSSPNLTFFRNNGTALFTSNVCIDDSRFFRMYNSTYNNTAGSETSNTSFEINGSNGMIKSSMGIIIGNISQSSLGDSSRIDLYDTTNAKIRLLGGSNQLSLGAKSGSNEAFVKTTGSQDLEFGTNDSYRLTIKSDGKVGIGTRYPSHNLHVEGTANISSSISAGSISVSSLSTSSLSLNGSINMNSNIIQNVGTPGSSGDGANKQYVDSVLPIGSIIMWSGSVANIPSKWSLCNGSNETPDLRNKFIIGAHSDYNGVSMATVEGPGTIPPTYKKSGGDKDSHLISHNHSGYTNSNTNDGGHTHGVQEKQAGYWEQPGRYGSGGNWHEPTRGGDPTPYNYAISLDHNHQVKVTSDDSDHKHVISSDGSVTNGTNRNLPPYYALAFIIRTS